MSDETVLPNESAAPEVPGGPADTPMTPQTYPALSPHESRVLGVLVEKAKTTPDVYPLSLNGLVTGCNQKNNREPVLSLAAAEVEVALADLKQKGYVHQIQGGGRVDKYKHTLYETLKVDKVQLAILAELLLRGAQTEGELRGRASRMEPIPDLEILRGHLRLLGERGLVVFLGAEGRRGTTITHGFHPAEELDRLRANAGRETAPSSRPTSPAQPPADLLRRVGELEAGLAELREQVKQLQEALSATTSTH